MKQDIINHTHRMQVGSESVEIKISCIKGYWDSDVFVDGDKRAGFSGGAHNSLQDYIKYAEDKVTYSRNLFNHGYNHAKVNS